VSKAKRNCMRATERGKEVWSVGASQDVAKQVAVNSRRWWRNSDRLLKTVLTIAYFDRLGVPRLS
jgi:RNA-directed DNA polymerase